MGWLRGLNLVQGLLLDDGPCLHIIDVHSLHAEERKDERQVTLIQLYQGYDLIVPEAELGEYLEQHLCICSSN